MFDIGLILFLTCVLIGYFKNTAIVKSSKLCHLFEYTRSKILQKFQSFPEALINFQVFAYFDTKGNVSPALYSRNQMILKFIHAYKIYEKGKIILVHK